MGGLNTTPNIANADDIYEAILEMHRGLDEDQSRLVNAKLILLLANHIGDEAILYEALRLARTSRKNIAAR